MDMITLAMAKNYTDEKCGGGSGGGLPVVINLNEWGIEIASIILSGGVREQTLLFDHEEFWGKIPADGNFVVEFMLDGGIVAQCFPSTVTRWLDDDEGDSMTYPIAGFVCQTFADYGDSGCMAIYIQLGAYVNENKEYVDTGMSVVVQLINA